MPPSVRPRTEPKPWEVFDDEILPKLSADILFGNLKNLKTDGPRWTAASPFTRDEGRSLVIFPQWLLWHCRATGASGGAVQFIQRRRDCDWLEAARHLADLSAADPSALELGRRRWSDLDFQRHTERERLFVLLEIAVTFVKARMGRAGGEAARSWLVTRGFTPDMIDALEFGLFPAPEEFIAFLREARLSETDAQALGLTHAKWGGRVVGPWRDLKGRPINLWGRHPGETPTGQWKYESLNRPDPSSPIGGKSVPMGLDRAAKAGKKNLLLVGGTFKALLPYAMGLTDPVPIASGGNLTDDQIATLEQYLGRDGSLTINWDYDPFFQGGVQERSLQTVERLKEASFSVFVIDPADLADGGDPYAPMDVDGFILRSPDGLMAYRAVLEQRRHGFRYKAQSIVRKHRTGEKWTDPALFAAIAEAESFDDEISDPVKVAELESFFWPEILKETQVRWETFQARRRSLQERQDRDREADAYEEMLREVGGLLREGRLDEGKRLLWDKSDRLRAQASTRGGDAQLSVDEELHVADAALSARRGHPRLGLRQSTLPKLDESMSGLRGLMVLAGGPGAGKSALMAQLALDTVRSEEDACVLLYSSGMRRTAWLTRLLSRLSGLDTRTLLLGAAASGDMMAVVESGRHFPPQEMERLRDAENQLHEYGRRIKIVDRGNFPGPTPEKLALIFEDFKARTTCARGLIMIDDLLGWPAPAEDTSRVGGDRSPVAPLASKLLGLRGLSEVDGVEGVLVTQPIHADLSGLLPTPGVGTQSQPSSPVAMEAESPWKYEELCVSAHIADSLMLLLPSRLPSRARADLERVGVAPTVLRIVKGRDGTGRGDVLLTFRFRTSDFEEVQTVPGG